MSESDKPEAPEPVEPVEDDDNESQGDGDSESDTDVALHDDSNSESDVASDGDRSGESPTTREIEGWHQHQKDMGRTDTSSTLAPLEKATAEQWLGTNGDPDVMLAIPNLGVDHIGLEVDNLRAHVELHAKVLDLLELHVGADASIEKVELNIENVRVQAMLKVRLDNVVTIVSRVMDTIDANPEILTNLTAGLGKGLETGLGKEHATQLEQQPGRLKGVESADANTSDAPQSGNGAPEKGGASDSSGEGQTGEWDLSPELSQPEWSKVDNDGDGGDKDDADDKSESKSESDDSDESKQDEDDG